MKPDNLGNGGQGITPVHLQSVTNGKEAIKARDFDGETGGAADLAGCGRGGHTSELYIGLLEAIHNGIVLHATGSSPYLLMPTLPA